MTNGLDDRTIVFVHPSDELYGADRCLLEIVRELPATTRAIVALPRDIAYEGALSRQLVAAGAEVLHLDFAVLRRGTLGVAEWPRLGRRLIIGTWQLASLVCDSRADIVHTNTLAAVSGPFAALLARRRHVWHIHELIADENWAVRLAYRLLLLLPGRVIGNSKATARALAGPIGVVRGKTTVVYPGVAVGRDIQRERRNLGDRLRVGFVGRLAPRKGVAELLEAVALVRGQGIDVELLIYGTAPPGQAWREGQYRRRARGLGLGDVARFEGFVEDVPRRLADIDVLVVPSQRPEPFGLVVLEGMAAGCAVLACRNGGGSDEIIEHGVTGLYCGRDGTSIAAAIERLAGDATLRERLGRGGRAAVGERFSREGYLEGVFGVYQALLH